MVGDELAVHLEHIAQIGIVTVEGAVAELVVARITVYVDVVVVERSVPLRAGIDVNLANDKDIVTCHVRRIGVLQGFD